LETLIGYLPIGNFGFFNSKGDCLGPFLKQTTLHFDAFRDLRGSIIERLWRRRLVDSPEQPTAES
jgi:hypothetical protein